VKCPKCGQASAMKAGARSHMCPYCGTVFRLEEATVIARAKSGKEAREIIKQINLPKGLRERLYGKG